MMVPRNACDEISGKQPERGYKVGRDSVLASESKKKTSKEKGVGDLVQI